MILHDIWYSFLSILLNQFFSLNKLEHFVVQIGMSNTCVRKYIGLFKFLLIRNAGNKLIFCPLWNLSHFAPRVVIGVGPCSRPWTAVTDDIFVSQVVFVKLGFFATTPLARRTDNHFIFTPVDPTISFL